MTGSVSELGPLDDLCVGWESGACERFVAPLIVTRTLEARTIDDDYIVCCYRCVSTRRRSPPP